MTIHFNHEKLTAEDLRELIEVMGQQSVEDGVCFSICYRDTKTTHGCLKGNAADLISALTMQLAQVYTDWKPKMEKREARKLGRLSAKLLVLYMGFCLEKGRKDEE